MLAIISPGYIKGELRVPASKSMMQRVCAAALLHKGKTTIHNPGNSADDKAALDIIMNLGAKVEIGEDKIEINSNGLNLTSGSIHCGESGLAARLFIPIAALSNRQITINASGSLLSRSMHIYNEVLPGLGVGIQHTNNKLPVTVQGPLQINNLHIDGSESSQFLSGLLFAYAFAATERVEITVSNLKSKPYIDLSLEVLQQFGRKIEHINYERFIIDPASFIYPKEVSIVIEGDWSSAVNWLVAAAINGELTLSGLNNTSSQADKMILDVLETAGVKATIDNDNIVVKKANPILPFEFDATDCPDLFPILTILAACSKGESSITGVHRLLNKESNRIVSTGDMLNEFGIFLSIEDDTMVVSGRRGVEHATIDSYNDHRIVMAASVAALRAQKPVVILGADAVNKSYPSFFSDLISLGANCILKEE